MHDWSPKVKKKQRAWQVEERLFPHLTQHLPTYGWKLKKKPIQMRQDH